MSESLEAGGTRSSDIRIASPNTTEAEIAAVTAVVTAALEELSNEHAATPVEVTGWQRSQRAIRTPLHPGPGEWRRG